MIKTFKGFIRTLEIFRTSDEDLKSNDPRSPKYKGKDLGNIMENVGALEFPMSFISYSRKDNEEELTLIGKVRKMLGYQIREQDLRHY